MNDLVLHPLTKLQLEQFIIRPSHGLLLVGSEGSGKYCTAQTIAAQLVDVPVSKLESYPYILQIRSDTQSISVDTVRSLQQFLKLKPASQKNGIVRVVIIENAGNLTTEAQNAILKILEEPPTDTAMILTSASSAELLPTVRSRVQEIIIRPPHANDIVRHFEKSHETTEITRAQHISGGRIGLMQAILSHDEHPLLAHIEHAKKLYTSSTFERLLFVDEFIKSKQRLDLLLQGLYIVSRAALQSAASKNDRTVTRRWLAIQKQLLTTENSLQRSPQAKLALTNLMMHL